MSLQLSRELIEATECAGLAEEREQSSRYRKDRMCLIGPERLDDETLQDLLAAAEKLNDGKVRKAVEAVIRSREGDCDQVAPSFQAFESLLTAYLLEKPIDGWLYVRGDDGRLTPELILSIDYLENQRGSNPDHVVIQTVSYGIREERSAQMGVTKNHHSFWPTCVTRKRVSAALSDKGLFRETPELKAEYEASLKRYRDEVENEFAEQFRFEGRVAAGASYDERNLVYSQRKVVHDTAPEDRDARKNQTDSQLYPDLPGHIPEAPVVRVFDLKSLASYWAHADSLTPYVYDQSLREKLVLPKEHRDLLDVLTTDLDAFVGDFVEGKSAGNVILCKGLAGLGKTLTAEVYAELIKRPLYSIHSGHLGTDAESVDRNLQEIFKRSKRWKCVLLLDEADVFVVRRGNSLEQNAIVAEFLRSLEYFDGLLFMTTNRPDDIDEAILSRCAAIIRYEVPKTEDMRAIWQVMARQYEQPLSEDLLNELVATYSQISPRDVKMLFRLALRVAQKHGGQLNAEVFRQCAMFRDIPVAA